MRSPRAILSRLVRRSARGTAPGPVGYAPQRDGRPDPGEVVWAWVPYEENDGRGKDRPVLLLGRRGGQWVGLMLTSKDHDRDAADEARFGRYWMDVGVGGWDRDLHDRTLAAGLVEVERRRVVGKDVTPFLLAWFHEHTGGASLAANVALVLANAELAAAIAAASSTHSGS